MPSVIAFSDKEIFEMIVRYESGDSMNDIAMQYGCGKNTIRSRLLDAGIEFNKGRSLSKKLTGRVSPRKGVTLSNEAKKKIGLVHKGNKHCLGRKLSDESKEKMRKARLQYLSKNPDAMRIAREAALLVNKLPDSERIARDKVRRFMKQSLHRCLRLSGRLKESRTEQMLGYSHAELREHIESKFTDDMSWENRGSFHIDHKTPIKFFMDNGISDPAIINALNNLQVLTPVENQRKSARMEELT